MDFLNFLKHQSEFSSFFGSETANSPMTERRSSKLLWPLCLVTHSSFACINNIVPHTDDDPFGIPLLVCQPNLTTSQILYFVWLLKTLLNINLWHYYNSLWRRGFMLRNAAESRKIFWRGWDTGVEKFNRAKLNLKQG